MPRDDKDKKEKDNNETEQPRAKSVTDTAAETKEREAERTLMDEELTNGKEMNDEDLEQRQDELELRLKELESSRVGSQQDYEALVGVYEELIDIIEARLRDPAVDNEKGLREELSGNKHQLSVLNSQYQEYSLTDTRIQHTGKRFLSEYERLMIEKPHYHDLEGYGRLEGDSFTPNAKDFFEHVATKFELVDLGSGGNYRHDAMIRLPGGIIVERTVRANYDVDEEHYRFLDAKKFRDETLKKIADKQREIERIGSQLLEVSDNEAKKSKLESDSGYLRAQIKWAQNDLKRFRLEEQR